MQEDFKQIEGEETQQKIFETMPINIYDPTKDTLLKLNYEDYHTKAIEDREHTFMGGDEKTTNTEMNTPEVVDLDLEEISQNPCEEMTSYQEMEDVARKKTKGLKTGPEEAANPAKGGDKSTEDTNPTSPNTTKSTH